MKRLFLGVVVGLLLAPSGASALNDATLRKLAVTAPAPELTLARAFRELDKCTLGGYEPYEVLRLRRASSSVIHLGVRGYISDGWWVQTTVTVRAKRGRVQATDHLYGLCVPG